MDREYYMGSVEAVDKGILDGIIGGEAKMEKDVRAQLDSFNSLTHPLRAEDSLDLLDDRPGYTVDLNAEFRAVPEDPPASTQEEGAPEPEEGAPEAAAGEAEPAGQEAEDASK